MRTNQKRALAVSGAVLAMLSAVAPAFAAPPPDVFKDSDGNVYVHGATSPGIGMSLPVEYVGRGQESRLRANYCGEVAITITSSRPALGNSITVIDEQGTSTIDVSALPVELRPRCVGQNLEEPRTNDYKTPDGDVILVGRTAGLYSEVSFNDLNYTSNRRANGCNFIRISNTTRSPLPASLVINGTTHSLSTLTEADPPVCRGNSSDGYTLYLPESWN